MTSQVNHEQGEKVVSLLQWIGRLLAWLGSPMLLLLAAAVGMMVSDHYTLGKTTAATAWMKPRVTLLYMTQFPDLYKREVSGSSGTNSIDQ